MLDVGWTELVVIAIVMIIVVGPKDLPPMLRTFGKMMTKMRGMASEFRGQFDEALKEADLDDIRKTLADAQRLNPAHSLREAMNPLRQMGNDIKADLQKATSVDSKPVVPTIPEVLAEAVLPEAQPVAIVPPEPVMTDGTIHHPDAAETVLTGGPVKRLKSSRKTADTSLATDAGLRTVKPDKAAKKKTELAVGDGAAPKPRKARTAVKKGDA